MKDQLKDRKEINNHEAAAVYIETFALKVFSNADNEDRKGGSNRYGKSLYIQEIPLTESIPHYLAQQQRNSSPQATSSSCCPFLMPSTSTLYVMLAICVHFVLM
jgi:hypothetical protein